MKNIIIVTSYANTLTKRKNLIKMLDSIKCDEFDILLVSNYILTDKEIFEKCDYYIYDKLNVNDLLEYGVENTINTCFFKSDNFNIDIHYNNGYHFMISRSIYLGLNLAKILNYDFFYYIDGDCILTKDNLRILTKIKDDFISKNKKAIFINSTDEENNKGDFYTTLIHGGIIKFFTEDVILPHNIEEWIKNDFFLTNGLERIYYKLFSSYSDSFYFIKWELALPNFLDVINKSVKIHEYYLTIFFYFNNDDTYLFTFNKYDCVINIIIKIDDEIKYDINLNINEYYYIKIDIKEFLNKKISYDIFKNNEFESNEEYILNKEKINNMKKTNKIYFK